MINKQIELLAQFPGVLTRHGASDSDFQSVDRQLPNLPLAHQELLRSSNGLMAFDGYFRIFGINSRTVRDAIWWNDPNSWKFAWDDRCADYWCFGETAWGDQYAYDADDLTRGSYSVFFLDALSMTAERIASHFEEFFEKEFVANARKPYDEMIVKTHQLNGPIDNDSLLVYSPSPLLGGIEDVANIQKMSARAAMICNGDLALQLDNGPENGEIAAVQPYQDKEGRVRVKLVWK